MLENRKNVIKIIAKVIAIIAIFGIFINFVTRKKEIETIPAEEFEMAKSSITLASLDLDKRSNSADVQTGMGKSIKFNRYK